MVADYPRRERGLPPLAIGHRGVLGEEPENTLRSFRAAVQMRLPIIEFDVRLTKDGEVVVIHDETLERTTSGRGRVRDYDLKQLRELDAGRWFSAESAGERIPLLDEVLCCIADSAWCLIELKEESAALVDRVAACVRAAGLERTTMLQAFSPAALRFARSSAPAIHRVLLAYDLPDPSVLQGGVVQALSVHARWLSSSRLQDFINRGLPLHAWPVDDDEALAACLAAGADAVGSNRSAVLKKLMALPTRAGGGMLNAGI